MNKMQRNNCPDSLVDFFFFLQKIITSIIIKIVPMNPLNSITVNVFTSALVIFLKFMWGKSNMRSEMSFLSYLAAKVVVGLTLLRSE